MLNDITFALEPGGFVADRRPVRQRQDHAARPARRTGPARRRDASISTAGPRRARRGRPRPAARREGRLRLPVVPADSRPSPRGRTSRSRWSCAARRRASAPRELLERVGLGDRGHHYPAQLSGGEQQRVALARAFSQPAPRSSSPTSPPATSTPRTGASIIDLMVELNRELGTTLVLVTHDLELAARARRTIRLADGAGRRPTARRDLRSASCSAWRRARSAPRRAGCSCSPRRSRSASPRWWRSTPSPTTCATRCGEQARALLGADLALEQPAAVPARSPSGCSTRWSAAARAVARGHQLRRHGLRPAHRLARAWCRWRRSSRLSVLRRDRDRRRPAPGRGCRAAACVVVDPSLLTALAARVGDTLALGEARFVITAPVASAPGDVGVRTAFGPAGLHPRAVPVEDDRPARLRLRAREYEAYLRLPAGADRQQRRRALRAAAARRAGRLRTVADDRERPQRDALRLGGYLGLVALVALLLGGLGVASAVSSSSASSMDTIAVLRCLGATGGQVVLASTCCRPAAMGSRAACSGRAAGVALQQVLPGCSRDLLPVDVAPRALLARDLPRRRRRALGRPRCSRCCRCSRCGGCRRSPRCAATWSPRPIAPRDPWRWPPRSAARREHRRARRRCRWAAGGTAPGLRRIGGRGRAARALAAASRR